VELAKMEGRMGSMGIDIKPSADAKGALGYGELRSELEGEVFGDGPDAAAEEAAAIQVASFCCSAAKDNAAKGGNFSCSGFIKSAVIKALPSLNYDMSD